MNCPKSNFLSVKLVIDIMAPAKSLQKSLPAIDAAAELEYLYGRLLED